jgi:hypothetical protein
MQTPHQSNIECYLNFGIGIVQMDQKTAQQVLVVSAIVILRNDTNVLTQCQASVEADVVRAIVETFQQFAIQVCDLHFCDVEKEYR